jgi:putative toxin-antitoxin system antitoxin component (TIGR02293 family)
MRNVGAQMAIMNQHSEDYCVGALLGVDPAAADIPFGTASRFTSFACEFNPIQAVREGLPTWTIDHFVNTGAISTGEVYELILPRKTLENRRKVGRLNSDQSDKLIRVARVIAAAAETFGSGKKAHEWLRRPTTALNDEEPMKLLDTEEGARIVENLLGRIAHGIAA